jgi:hypothetical protein
MHATAVLFAGFGSGVPAVTEPVVHTWPTDERHGTEITTWAVAPWARVVQEHATVWPLTVHVAPCVVVVVGLGPLKRLDVALSSGFWASLGPGFETTSVKVAVPLPALPVVVTVWERARSADVRTVPQTVAESSLRTGSGIDVEALAVSHSCPPSAADALSRTTIEKVELPPGVREPVRQVTTPDEPTAGFVQLPPIGVPTDWNVAPFGTTSTTVTAGETLGPLFVTVIV